MKLDSARELKQRVKENILASPTFIRGSAFRLPTPGRTRGALEPAFAVGVSRNADTNEYSLALRVRSKDDLNRPELSQALAMAHGEVDLRYTGSVSRLSAPWHQQINRPLLVGGSIGHYMTTAGTVGGFVCPKGQPQGDIFVLSNNHVLAEENLGQHGDDIFQPAPYDGGTSADTVASLDKFITLAPSGNLVDAAIGRISPTVRYDVKKLTGLGTLSGLSGVDVDVGLLVSKLGRTTGLTHGRVTAFELDDVAIAYDLGVIKFDSQIEIESVETDPIPFSSGGDSGSLIVDENLGAVALLFAGSETGGTNGAGLTYASPIQTVLDLLQIDLLF